tara:strand:- start:15801 stop:15977 length:177 start_codon:yes stop_codon:yes gene_type:complete
MRDEECCDISLWDITFEVNGKLYTTNNDFDHSWFCSGMEMSDLELLPDAQQLKENKKK